MRGSFFVVVFFFSERKQSSNLSTIETLPGTNLSAFIYQKKKKKPVSLFSFTAENVQENEGTLELFCFFFWLLVV